MKPAFWLDLGFGMSAGLALGLGTGSALFGMAVVVLMCLGPRISSLSRLWWGPVTVIVGGVALLAVRGGLPVEDALLGVLAWLLLHRRLLAATHGGARADRVSALIVGLILVASGTRTADVLFLVATALWVGMLPIALGPPGVSRGGLSFGTRWTLVLGVGLLTIPMFWALPRFTGASTPEEDRSALTGFTDNVDLGEMDALLDDPARVFVARFSAAPQGAVYFRGVALDRFDGRRWSSASVRQREEDWTDPLPDLVRVDIELEAHSEGVLFAPGVVEGLDANGVAVERDDAGAYHLPGPARDVSYAVFTRPPFGKGRADPFVDAAPRLEVPELSEEARSLFSAQVEGVEGPLERMEALRTWLNRDYQYTREPRDADTEAPLERFLLQSRSGHCEYFASALAIGGRVVGVPTRVVNGFVGGEAEAGDPTSFVVRRYHAHSWVEFFDGDRWITIDATPSLLAPAGPGLVTRVSESVQDFWEGAVVDYDADTQLETAAWVARTVTPFAPEASQKPIGIAVVGGVLGGMLLLARRLVNRFGRRATIARRPPEDPVTAELQRAWDAIESAGLDRPRGPDVEGARLLAQTHPSIAQPLEALAWLSYEVRFGPGAVEGGAEDRMARARGLASAVQQAIAATDAAARAR